MSGGQLTIRGDAGPFAGSGMKGGTLDIEGDAGERLGGPLSGETVGMSGGVLHVRGDAGARAGDRLRRGFILIEGRAGAYAGSRMIAGTLAIGGEAGDLPGYLMGRGTILLGRGATLFSPTFGDCGEHDLVAARLLANYIAQTSAKLASLFRQPLRRLAGDLAALGKGEILLPQPVNAPRAVPCARQRAALSLAHRGADDLWKEIGMTAVALSPEPQRAWSARGSRASLALADLYRRDRLRRDPAMALRPPSPDGRLGSHVSLVA